MRHCGRSRRWAWILLAAGISLATSPVAGDPPVGYETPPTLSASEVLPPELREGPHHRIADEVTNDGYLNTYTIESDFGTFTARGDDLLRVRIDELQALATLSEVSKTEAFAKALAGAAMKPVETVTNVVTQPVETVKGIPSGVSRYFKRTSRKIKKTAKQVEEKLDEAKEAEEAGEDEAEVGEEEGTLARTQEVATDATKSYLGVGGATREWAMKLGVDPYSTNETLQQELSRVASVAAVGSFAVRKATPSLGVIDYLGEVNDMVWTMSADDLEVLNHKRLKQMGLENDEIEALFENPAYSPSRVTSLVSALHGIEGVAGRAELARLAGAATSEEEAFFFQRSAEMLRSYHSEVAPVGEIARGQIWGGGITTEGTCVIALALDYLAWTEDAATALAAATERYRGGTGVERLEIWLAGRASPRARQELEALGWRVEEGARERWIERPTVGAGS